MWLIFVHPSYAESIEPILTIEVKERRPDYLEALSQVLPQEPLLNETSFSIDSLASLLTQSAAVNLNGQGGLFQTINIRGFSHWRIRTLVEGIPIHTERRAGSVAEFLPPIFIENAYLTTGAASSQLGSGALGGGVDFFLKTPQTQTMQLSYSNNNSYQDIAFLGSDQTQQYHWLATHRQANNSRDGDGNPILDQFEQQAAAIRITPSSNSLKDLIFIYSRATDVAKASADNPIERFTLYPNNSHLLSKASFNWHNATLYLHGVTFDTSVIRPGERINNLENEALNFGLKLNDSAQLAKWQLNWRMAIDSRTGVKVYEGELDNAGQSVFENINVDANQVESNIAIDIHKPTSLGHFIGGASIAHIYQRDRRTEHSLSDINLSAFAGHQFQLSKSWQLTAYLSQAFRNPSLTERYYVGSTPRGLLQGDTELETETALNAEMNFAFSKENKQASVSLFRQHISDHIERVNITDELRQYRNLERARIDGINYQAQYQYDWRHLQGIFRVAGQWLQGEDKFQQRLADIPPAQHQLSFTLSGQNAEAFISFIHRQSSPDPIDGERATPSISWVDIGYKQQLSEQTMMAINLTNLNDTQYVTSRDELAPFAQGRNITLSLQYEL